MSGYMIGIDEAGRGPVLGPLVYGACWCPIDQAEQLKELGFADSKTLTPETRDEMRQSIEATEFLSFKVDVIQSYTISEKMLRENKYNLNLISHDSAIGLIKAAIDQGVNIQQVFVDTVGDVDKYQRKLSELFPGIKCVVAKKADSLFPIVSAASICAKTTRDKIVQNWVFPEDAASEKCTKVNRDFGSGYPSDGKTQLWMKKNQDLVFGFPSFVRFSWGTTKTLLDANSCAVLWPEEYDEIPPPIDSFFGSGENHQPGTTPRLHRPNFYRRSHIKRIKI